MKFSKKDIAVRQIDTAIRLFFNNEDPVSVRTLAGAASLLLQELNETEGRPSFVEEAHKAFPDLTKSQIINTLREAQNWFKHGKKRGAKSSTYYVFEDEENDLAIFITLYECLVCFEGIPISAQVFWAWFSLCYPDLVKNSAELAKYFEIDESKFRKLSREKKKLFGAKLIKQFQNNETLLNDSKTIRVD